MTKILRLLDELDSLARPKRASTIQTATRAELFLQYNARQTLASKSITAIERVLDLTTTLLPRLHSISIRASEIGTAAYKAAEFVYLQRCEGLANLEHMLLCLQQASLDALISNTVKSLEEDVIHWYDYWKQRKHTCEAWFTEWSGQRPLSTTWPWNIRPTLVVLWGVCWMFYGAGDSSRRPEQAAAFSGFLWTGQSPQPAQPATTSTCNPFQDP